MIKTAKKFHDELLKNGIPIYGVSMADSSDKSTWVIDFKPEATQQQKDDANGTIKANFDNSVKATKTDSDLFYEIDALTSDQREKLFCMMLSDFLQRRPDAIDGFSGFSGWAGLDVRGDKLV